MTDVHRPAGAMALFAVFALGFATPALADTDLVVNYHPDTGAITRSIKVSYADLQVGSTAGRTTLRHRLTLAAKKVCDYNGGYGLRQPPDYTRCFREAKAAALNEASLIQTALR
jgi:UrcA family protein